MNYNRVVIAGRVGQDPEVRYTQGGTAVCNLSIATSEKWTDKAGEKQERTTWHKCVAWGKQAEVLGQHVQKGALLLVEGSLETQEWDDKEGNKRQTTQVRIKEFQFGPKSSSGGGQSEKSSRRDDSGGYGGPKRGPDAGYGDDGGYGSTTDGLTDDIPF